MALNHRDTTHDHGGVSDYYDRYCVGAKCMAWRWAVDPPENRVSGEVFFGWCGLVR